MSQLRGEAARVSIGDGTRTNVSTTNVKAEPDPDRTSALYHIMVVGVKPETAINGAGLKSLAKAMDGYR